MMSTNGTQNKETAEATLAGGCFWCLEAVFLELEGIRDAMSGYTGGEVPDPSYERVCSGNTGHAEAVRLSFDPKVISFEDVLGVFFSIHDPTTKNRQGADVGSQYRSAIFYHDAEQKAVAERVIKALDSEKVWTNPIVTEVLPRGVFYPAEDYHRDYFRKNPNQGYCQAVISPKMAKFRRQFSSRLKK